MNIYFIGLSVVAVMELLFYLYDIRQQWYLLALMLCWVILTQVHQYYLLNKQRLLITVLIEGALVVSLCYLSQEWLLFLIFASGMHSIFNQASNRLTLVYLVFLLGGSMFVVNRFAVVQSVGLILIGFIWLFVSYMNQQMKDTQRLVDGYKQHNASLVQQLNQIEVQLIAAKRVAALMERDRISRELHDSIGHRLSTIVIQLGAIERLTMEALPSVSTMTRELRTFTSEGLQDVRKVVHDMRPQHLEELSIIVGLERLFNEAQHHSAIEIVFRHNTPLWTMNQQQILMLYRIAQEFISNTQKHAQASTIKVTLIFQEKECIFTMSDNGIGSPELNAKMGMHTMRQRAEELGGKFTIQSNVGKGVKIQVVVPKISE
ncbi:sensor histidine kinase [Aerococcaceae bacterium zg-BR22]|uniref:sensor histidine kinase n=1 Tax=Aerococcaceae bacterium zg-1292 TaxID=2774330 RepID=UPI0040631119|nr:sensor histidine kinase [Aerococcaceae bacterium zg-BR22]